MRRWIVAWIVVLAAGAAWAGSPVPDLLRGYLLERQGEDEAALEALEAALDEDPASAVIRAEIARLLGRARRYGEALAVVDEGLSRRPGNPELLLLRARLLHAQGRTGEAAKAAREAAEAGGGREAFDLAVRLYEAANELDEALAEADRWIEARSDADAWFARGRVLARMKRFDQARKALQRGLELDPNHRPALQALATLEERAGNLARAEALYRRVVDANPHDVEARFRLGQLLLKQDRVAEALKVFEAAERWAGDDPSLRLRLGVLLLQSDRVAEAETVFGAMAEARGDDPLAWYLLGVTRLAQEKYEAALEAFEKVPETSTHYTDALVRRALALENLGRAEEARRILEAWLADHPDDEEVTLALAGHWEDQGDYRRAIGLLEGFLEKHPTRNYRVYFTLGLLYDKLKDWRKSAEYMRRSLEINPDDPYALNYLGYTYAEHGVNLEEAERLIQRALEIRPDDGFITDSLGWVYYKQGRYEEAAETLRRAVEIAPEDPVIWEHLGDALRKLGRDDEARKAYEKALELAPDTESARKKLEGLR